MKLRVLLVEDDAQYGELLKFWLESEGHDVTLAETLEDGFLGIAAEPLPDLVLLDIHLGQKNGLTLVHWARKQKHLAHLTIAATTGMGTFKDLKSISEAGCDTCFVKPIDLQALRDYLDGLAPSIPHSERPKVTR